MELSAMMPTRLIRHAAAHGLFWEKTLSSAVLVIGLAAMPSSPLHAQENVASPAGQWLTYGDKGSKVQALVQITEANGVLNGTLVKSLVAGDDPNDICDKCTGERKNKPIAGLVFLTGLKLREGKYSGGEILDPETGATYRCTLKLLDNGHRLLVRGYVGVSLLGRSQEWIRAD